MLYKCENCDYTTNRATNLRRHKARKIPCFTRDGNTTENTSLHVNVTVGKTNVTETSPVVADKQTDVTGTETDVKETLKCSKCNKTFLSKLGWKKHVSKCDGLDSKQCPICLKVFATRQSKYEHKKYVKCKPPTTVATAGGASSSGAGGSGVHNSNNVHNNITNNNNIDNSTNINITNNNHIRNNFYSITESDIDRIVEKLGDKEYFKQAMNNVDIGRYAIPRAMERIYFNDDFPDLQTIKKERRNDRLVDVHVGDGKWEKRFIDDVFKLVIRRVEEYHTKFFRYMEEKYKNVPVGSVRWKQIMRPVKTFGNCMLWYDGFRGDAIECLGIELNYPDEEDPEIEKERERRIKEMEQLVGEKVYEESLAAMRRAEAE